MKNQALVTKSTKIIRRIGLDGNVVQANRRLVVIEINGRPRATSAALREQYGLPVRSRGHHGEIVRDFQAPVETGSVRMTVGETGIRVEFRNFVQ